MPKNLTLITFLPNMGEKIMSILKPVTRDFGSASSDINQFMVGVDNFLTGAFLGSTPSNYPPHNIICINRDTGEYCIELATAGFSKEELKLIVTTEGNLVVSGKKAEVENPKQYNYKGISARSFKKNFYITSRLEVSEVSYKDGLLKIFLTQKPETSYRSIEISG